MSHELTEPAETVDIVLLKQLLIRLMTRNQPDRVKAIADRAQMEKNFLTLESAPEAHIAFVMQIMDRLNLEGRPATFEAGLIFGVAMAMAAGQKNGKILLEKMLADIKVQQDAEVEKNGKEKHSHVPNATKLRATRES